MVSVGEKRGCLFEEMFLKIWYLPTYSHGAESGFASNVWVRGGEEGFNFGKEISRHFDGSNVSKSTEGESDNVLIRVVEIANTVSRAEITRKELTFSMS